MQSLYPLALADKSWDNVGLLLDPPKPRPRDPALRPSILLTIEKPIYQPGQTIHLRSLALRAFDLVPIGMTWIHLFRM